MQPAEPLIFNEQEREQFICALHEEAQAVQEDPAILEKIILMLKERLFSGDAATLAHLLQDTTLDACMPWLKSMLWHCAGMTDSPARAGTAPLISELFAIPLIIDPAGDAAPLPERITDRDLAIFLSQSFRDCRLLQAHADDRMLVMPRLFTLGQLHAWSPVTVHDLLHELLETEADGHQPLLHQLFFATGSELATDPQFDLPPHARFMETVPLMLRFLVGVHTFRPEDDAVWRRGQTAAAGQWQDAMAGALDTRFGSLFTVHDPLPFHPALQAGWMALNLERVARLRQHHLERLRLLPAEVFEVISWHGPTDAAGSVPEATELHIGFFQPGPPVEAIGGAIWPLTALDDAASVERQLSNEQKGIGLMGCDTLADLHPVANAQGWVIFPADPEVIRACGPRTAGPTTRQ